MAASNVNGKNPQEVTERPQGQDALQNNNCESWGNAIRSLSNEWHFKIAGLT